MKRTASYTLARLRDAMLLTLCSAATTVAAVIAILMIWNRGVVNTVLVGSPIAWLVGTGALAAVGWVGYALQRPPGAADADR